MKKGLVLFLALFVVVSGLSYGQEIVDELNFTTLLKNVEDVLDNIEDFSADVEIELIENKRVNTTRINVKASKSAGVARIEFIEPKVLAGQIIVANSQLNQLQVYMPIAQQILISPLETAGADLGLGVNLTDLNSIFDFSGVTGTIEEVIHTEQELNYLVKVTGLDENQTQLIWIDQDFVPFKLAVYDHDNYLGSLFLSNLLINEELTPEELQKLPRVTKVKV